MALSCVVFEVGPLRFVGYNVLLIYTPDQSSPWNHLTFDSYMVVTLQWAIAHF